MIPESELARALARWKARKLGLTAPASAQAEQQAYDGGHAGGLGDEAPVPVFEETTRVASNQYVSEMLTPPAEVQLDDGDYEDYTRTRGK
jgi:hypothetical protein